jgi:hypothetical protein
MGKPSRIAVLASKLQQQGEKEQLSSGDSQRGSRSADSTPTEKEKVQKDVR